MRFLADENCDFTVVRALRAAGHDVLCVSEITPRAEDSEVIFRPMGLFPRSKNAWGDLPQISNLSPKADFKRCC